MTEITVYKSPTCAQCPMVLKFLEMNGIKPKIVDITEDRAAAQKLWDHGYQTVPVTSNGTEYVAGTQYGQIKKLWQKEDTVDEAVMKHRKIPLYRDDR